MCKAVIIAFDCLFRFKTVMRRVHTILLANHNDKIRLIERITIILFSSQYELLQHRDIGTTWKFFKFQVSFLAGHNFITKISFVLRAVWFAKPVLVPLIVWIMIAHKLNSISWTTVLGKSRFGRKTMEFERMQTKNAWTFPLNWAG